MTIYWDRCDLCGQYRPTRSCTIIPSLQVDIHCCAACPYRGNKCTSPTWKIEVPSTGLKTRREISSEEKERLLRELESLLKGS